MERLARRSFLASAMATLGGIALASCGGTSASNGPVTLRWSMRNAGLCMVSLSLALEDAS